MAEAYYAAIAPHNPLGPIALAAGLQLAASIPNFLCQEQVNRLVDPFDALRSGRRSIADVSSFLPGQDCLHFSAAVAFQFHMSLLRIAVPGRTLEHAT